MDNGLNISFQSFQDRQGRSTMGEQSISNWLFYGASTAKGHRHQHSMWAVYDHNQDTQGLLLTDKK